MATADIQESSQEHPAAEALLAALREAGPTGLAELIGDTDFLLSALAATPRKMFEPGARPRGAYKNLLDTIHDARSSLDALEARAVVALAEATSRDQVQAARDDAAHENAHLPPLDRLIRQADARTARDFSLVTRRSPSTTKKTLTSAQRLVGAMPRMLQALAGGKITATVAYATASATGPLDDRQRRQVDAILFERLPRMDGAGVKRWQKAVAEAITELDPQGTASRHQAARKVRHVNFTPGEHGMATVSAFLPALDAKLVHKRLSLEAERRRADGARHGHGALMADALVDTLLGRDGGMEPVTLELGIMMTERALLSPDHGDVAHIEGYGPVPVEALREELRNALAEPDDPAEDRYGPDGPQLRVVLRRLFLHPTAGELVAVESQAREFPAALKRFLNWRDGTCRAPYCDAPLRHHDHIVPASKGGPTSLDNGQGACAYCNLAREDDTARVERIEDPELPGHLVAWTGHGGTTVVSSAPPLGPVAPVVPVEDSHVDTGASSDEGHGAPSDRIEAQERDRGEADGIIGSADVAPCAGKELSISCRIPDRDVGDPLGRPRAARLSRGHPTPADAPECSRPPTRPSARRHRPPQLLMPRCPVPRFPVPQHRAPSHRAPGSPAPRPHRVSRRHRQALVTGLSIYCGLMIRHTVSFTLVHAPDSAAERDFLTEAPALLREIDGVADFVVSRQVSPKSDFRFQFAMTFADEATFAAYDAHPDHQQFVATRWQDEVSAFEELDFIAYP
ncbi:hypothetical protein GCM10023160_11870 [Brachybacterium paraconglomeratum]|uniref:Dabb family protein n=1 Tax=Brachybacterium paraconglomeratum TaxID=173362 RepID=UPI0031EF0779